MFKNPQLQVAAAMVASLLTLSTVFFHFAEGWSLFNSFYFSVVTMSTVGYGQIVPMTVLGKMGVIVLIFSGVGALAVLVQIVATDAIKRHTKSLIEEEFDEERELLERLDDIQRRKKKKA